MALQNLPAILSVRLGWAEESPVTIDMTQGRRFEDTEQRLYCYHMQTTYGSDGPCSSSQSLFLFPGTDFRPGYAWVWVDH